MTYVSDMGIAPNGVIYAGGIRFYYLDGIYTIALSGSIHDDVRDISFSPTSNGAPMYIATDGGICRNTNGGQSGWESINGTTATGSLNKISVNQFYDLDVSETNPEIMYGGTHDCGTLRRNANGTWTHILGSDGGSSAVSSDDVDNIICTSGAGNVSPLTSISGSTISGGNGWSYSPAPWHFNIYNQWVQESLPKYNSPVARDMQNGERFYSGAYRLWKSTDGGQSFDYDEIGAGTGSCLSAIDVAPTTSDAYAFAKFDNYHTSNSGSLNITKNDGTNWLSFTNATYPYPFIPNMDYVPITDIEFAADDEDVIFICFGGFNPGGKVYHCTDNTYDWKDLTFNLPNIPMNDLEYDEVNHVLYLGTDIGLYYYDFIGNSWELAGGMPLLPVSSINIVRSTGEMVLGTFGRGVWRADVICPYDAYSPQNVTADDEWDTPVKLTSDLNIQNNSTLTISSELKLPDDATITIENGSTLLITNTGSLMGACKIYTAGSVDVQPGGTLIINGGSVRMEGDGKIIVDRSSQYTGTLTYNEGSSIELLDDETYIEFIGDLEIGANAEFTFTGNGFLKFSYSTEWDPRNIIAGTGSSISLYGSGKNNKVIEINQRQMYIPEEVEFFTLSNAYVEMVHDYAELTAATCYPVVLSQVKFAPPCTTRTHHSGLVVAGQSILSISDCDFLNGEKGVCGYLQFCSNSPLTINWCTFTNNNYGVWINDKSAKVNGCTFTDCTSGFYSQATSSDDNEINDCTFDNCVIPIRHLNSSGNLLLNNNIINYANTYAITAQGDLILTGLCNTVSGVAPSSACAIYASNNCIVSLGDDLSETGGNNSFSTNGYQILLSGAKFLYMTNGLNKMWPNNQTYKIYGTVTMYPCSSGTISNIPANENHWYNNTNALSSSNYLVAKHVCAQYYTINGSYEPYEECGGTKSLTIGNTANCNSSMSSIAYASAESTEKLARTTNNWADAFDAFENVLAIEDNIVNNENIHTKELAWVSLKHCLKQMVLLNQIDVNSQYFDRTLELMEHIRELQQDNEARLFYLEVEKAIIFRLKGQYETAIDILEPLLLLAHNVEESDYINRWICILNMDIGVRDGIITLSNIAQYSKDCETIGMSDKLVRDYHLIEKGNAENLSSLIVEIMPNPIVNQSILTITLPDETNAKIEIVSVDGKTLKQLNVAKKTNRITINKDDLPKGIYNVKVSASNGETATTRMVIQ